MTLSVIIPIAPGEAGIRRLVNTLLAYPVISEIICVVTAKHHIDHSLAVKWVICDRGRAAAMNQGAELARGRWLWFIHIDSQIRAENIYNLSQAISREEEAVFYFSLAFTHGWLMKFTAWGANMRSKYFSLPFGDQALCLQKTTFKRLGGFNEDVAYGEDHLLMWQAKHQQIPIRGLNSRVATSPRKYEKNGWLKTTFHHQYLWLKQACPEYFNRQKSQ